MTDKSLKVINLDENDAYIHITGHNGVIEIDGMNCVIEVRGMGAVVTIPENKIDTRLKDAAPEMAETLKAINGFIPDWSGKFLISGEDRRNFERMRFLVRDALVKAGLS